MGGPQLVHTLALGERLGRPQVGAVTGKAATSTVCRLCVNIVFISRPRSAKARSDSSCMFSFLRSRQTVPQSACARSHPHGQGECHCVPALLISAQRGLTAVPICSWLMVRLLARLYTCFGSMSAISRPFPHWVVLFFSVEL